MATKRRLAEQILRIRAGGDVPQDFFIKPQEVYLLIGQITNDLVKLDYYLRKKEGDNTPPAHFIVTFEDVEVKYNEKRKHYYIDLPANYISLPYNKGIHHISPMDCEDEEVILVESNALWLDRDSIASMYENQVAARVEGKKVIFLTDLQEEIDKVLVKLIIADPNDMDEDMEFMCDPAIERTIIERVLSMLPDSEDTETVDKSV